MAMADDAESTLESYKKRSDSTINNPLRKQKEVFVNIPEHLKDNAAVHTPFYQK
jgi:hypothetical protein